MTRLLRALLFRLLPADMRVPLVRDLDEEFGRRPWSYGLQVLRSVPFALWLRIRRWRLGSLVTDLRHGTRSLRRAPWYVAAVVGVIAMSTAFGVTAFAVVDGALFRPLPFRDASRVFAVSPVFSRLPPRRGVVSASVAELEAWSAAIPDAVFGAAYTVDRASFSPTESENSSWVSARYLEALGVSPLIGGFEAADYTAGVQDIQPALITFSLWRRRFAGTPDVLGQTYRGDRRGVRIVGILPPGFAMPGFRPPEVIAPMNFSGRQRFSRGTDNQVIVRLPAGMTPEEATARLRAGQAPLAAEWPPPPDNPRMTEAVRISLGPADDVVLLPIREAMTTTVGQMSWIVFASAVVLLMLACLNVAALAAARARDRWRDLSVRRALGAQSFDVFRALAAEHALVVAAGVAAGTLLAQPVLRATLARMPAWALLREAAINTRVLAFAALLAVVCLVTMAILSAAAAHRRNLRASLAEGGATTVRRRSWLVTAQIALATVVTLGSGLVVGSLIRVWNEDHGFRTSTGVVRIGGPRGATPAQIEQLVERLGHLPGVESLGGMNDVVLQRTITGNDFDPPDGRTVPDMGGYGVTTGYFETAGLQLVEGRFPTAAEHASGARVVVVSTIAARAYWGDRPAVGQTLTSGGRTFAVIGVVRDGRYTSWDRDPVGEIYQPLTSLAEASLQSILVIPRPGTSLADLAAAFAEACPDCRVFSAKTVADTLNDTIQTRRFRAWLFAGFGGIALVITATGMLGLVAMTAARRTREIGIRLALGATRPRVVRQIVREQLGGVAMGLLAGGAAGAAAVRPLTSLLYKTEIYDPVTWSAAIAMLIGVSLVAAALPSLRASRVDLVGVLKPE